MPAVLEIIPDPFLEVSKGREGNQKRAGGEPGLVRRPNSGTQLDKDTFASLSVVTSAGAAVPLLDAGGTPDDKGAQATSTRYTNFLLQSVSEDRMEKQQILETFGEPYIFFFGERPRILNFQGILINTFDFNGEAEWWHNYDNYLRGTKLTEMGENISAGERQLLTIARAFLADPAVLILDEATSSVDTRTEVLIQRAMAELRKGRTSFVIAHRLSTIRDADVILVLNHGRVVEQGTHVELLAAEGFYYDLYQSQFNAAIE